MKRRMTAAERRAQSERMRQAWAQGKFAGRSRPRRGDFWRGEEDALLREWSGVLTPAEMAARLYGRSETAVVVRLSRLGLSRATADFTLTQLEWLFGVCHRTIVKHWVTTGLLPCLQESKGHMRRFKRADVEAFVRDHGWAYDWAVMRPGQPLTKLAETVNRADPWLDYGTLGRALGIRGQVNLDRWRWRGLIPHRRRYGAGGKGEIVVRRRDVPVIREAIAQARARGAARGVTRREAAACSKQMGYCPGCGRETRVGGARRCTGTPRQPLYCRFDGVSLAEHPRCATCGGLSGRLHWHRGCLGLLEVAA